MLWELHCLVTKKKKYEMLREIQLLFSDGATPTAPLQIRPGHVSFKGQGSFGPQLELIATRLFFLNFTFLRKTTVISIGTMLSKLSGKNTGMTNCYTFTSFFSNLLRLVSVGVVAHACHPSYLRG
jgi:hypothetical protein